jgi:molybdopterin/thiamine biosynthesis adenylyltransferase
VSLQLKATPLTTPESVALDDWFAGLGDEYLGRLPEGSLRSGMTEGWRLRWRGCELEVQVDADFPYSAARVYLVGYARSQVQPHIEKNGRLCLGGKPVPGNSVQTVRIALAEAFRLLTENEARQHDDDFHEDFGLYWLTWASRSDLFARILPGFDGARKSRHAHAVLTKSEVFVLPSKADAIRFWVNRTGAAPKRPKTTAVVSIDPLPSPARYPNSAADLWALVEARSQGGTDLLAKLVQSDPKEAFVILAGTATSGREHYAALRIRPPLDRKGNPLKRRFFRGGIERTENPIQTLFERFDIERLPTTRLDASSTRLPDGVQREMAASKVVVVGCGALGSGVARMLAQAGVEHLHLVDPENLGWENIRRHELGARVEGRGKAEALADAIRVDLPMIGFVQRYKMTFATFARKHSEALKQADLVVSCTGDWTADASVEHAMMQLDAGASGVYGWVEAHALAAHAVLVRNSGAKLSDGFDESGEFRLPVVIGGKPPPPECGGASTPFGAIELSNAQALVAGLAVDALRRRARAPAWRSWLADTAAFEEAEAAIATAWIAKRGRSDDMGGLIKSDWTFR